MKKNVWKIRCLRWLAGLLVGWLAAWRAETGWLRPAGRLAGYLDASRLVTQPGSIPTRLTKPTCLPQPNSQPVGEPKPKIFQTSIKLMFSWFFIGKS